MRLSPHGSVSFVSVATVSGFHIFIIPTSYYHVKCFMLVEAYDHIATYPSAFILKNALMNPSRSPSMTAFMLPFSKLVL